jgi:hypothetical protein
MAIKNPARFGLKTFLVGAAIALTLGVFLVASGICPPLVVMPAMLIFILANSPIFAWAGAYAGIAAIGAVSAFAGVATAAVLETVDRVASAVWRLGKWLTGTSKEETTASTGTRHEGGSGSSYRRMNEAGVGKVDDSAANSPFVKPQKKHESTHRANPTNPFDDTPDSGEPSSYNRSYSR